MRQASEWKHFVTATPALLLLGLVGAFTDGYRSDLFQVTALICNWFVFFLVGYYWTNDRPRHDHASGRSSRAVVAIGWGMSNVSLVVSTFGATVLILSSGAPSWVLASVQLSLPLHGFFHGVLYRVRVVRRGIVHRFSFLRLVGDTGLRPPSGT